MDEEIISIIKCGMEWLVHSQTSAVQIWMTLTCWPGDINGAWVESVSHVTRIGQIGMEPWSGHCKNFKRSGLCKNFKRPAWLDLFTWKQYVTYRDLMSCVYASYQANRSNRHRTEYDLDLLTWKWCVMRHPSMGFICASYEVNRSNSQGADITKTSRQPMWLWPLAFWPRNGPYDLYLGHISISQIGMETQSTFEMEMVCDTSWPHGLYLYHISMGWCKKDVTPVC